MKLLLPAFILAVASLLPAVPASAQTTSPVVAAPTSLKRALLDWSWTWTGPQSNTVVTFQERGRLITQENQVSAWDFLSANTIRVTASGMRPVFLTFNQDFSHFVQSGGGMAPIAGRRHQLLLYQNLLDAAHAGYWRLCGFLQIKLQNGLVDTASPKGPGYSQSVLWYSAQKFGDFSLRLDFNRKERCNSGVFIRFDDPGSDPEKPASLGHEVDINTADDTGGIAYYKRPGKVPEEAAEKLGEWNSMEISIIGSHIRVSLNHRLINEYDLGVAPAGYIGLQNFEGGEGMKFRNVRIKELPSSPLVARQPQTLAEALLGHGWRWHAASQGTSDPEFDVYFMPDGNVKHLRAGGGHLDVATDRSGRVSPKPRQQADHHATLHRRHLRPSGRRELRWHRKVCGGARHRRAPAVQNACGVQALEGGLRTSVRDYRMNLLFCAAMASPYAVWLPP